MVKGRAPPAELTQAATREFYQVDGQEEDIVEDLTAITGWLAPQQGIAAVPA